MDGEGMTDLQKFYRQKGIQLGVIEPSDEEKAQLEEAAASAQNKPDPQADYLTAKAEESKAAAQEKLASAGLKTAQAEAVGGPEAAPTPPDGLEQAHKAAQIGKTVAETEKLRTDTAHMPEKLAIERSNADTNRFKVHQHGALERFKSLFTGPARPRQ
jgi:hypothetical protein